MFHHIVVGADGTPEGRDAVALGAAIASATGAGLSLVGVFPVSLVPVAPDMDRQSLRAQAARVLRRDRDRLAPQALIHTVADGSVPRALRHQAARWHADLVIIGSDRAAEPGRARIGRRGRQLLHDAPFALAIAARGWHERARQLRSVAVGYDGGAEATAAVDLAAQLAGAAGARLLVRRVVEDQVPALSGEQWLALQDWDHGHLWETARQTALGEAEDDLAALGIEGDVSATVGDPGYELRDLSATTDLVVIGSRRWGPVARLISGGVGETLVADAGCSVLIVPRPAQGDASHRIDEPAMSDVRRSTPAPS